MSELWIPGASGPTNEFVARLHAQIQRFAHKRELDRAVVEIELRDGARYKVSSVSADPGYGFITICPHPGDDVPGEIIVPLSAIGRVELYHAEEPEPPLGFSLPSAD